MYTGPSGFAIMNERFPRRRFLRQYPKGMKKPFLPVLYKYFGLSWVGINDWFKLFWYEDKLIEFHLCFRKIDPRIPQYAADIARRIAEINAPNTKLLLCPCLEDRVPDREWRTAAKKVRSAAPGIRLVRCPLELQYRGGKFEERHNKHPLFTNKPPQQRIINTDGCTIDFNDNEQYLYALPTRRHHILSEREAINFIKTAKRNKIYAFSAWSAYQQGLQKTKNFKDKPPVNQRQYIVTDEALQGMRRVLNSIARQ